MDIFTGLHIIYRSIIWYYFMTFFSLLPYVYIAWFIFYKRQSAEVIAKKPTKQCTILPLLMFSHYFSTTPSHKMTHKASTTLVEIYCEPVWLIVWDLRFIALIFILSVWSSNKVIRGYTQGRKGLHPENPYIVWSAAAGVCSQWNSDLWNQFSYIGTHIRTL
jgi:hypothetical protein